MDITSGSKGKYRKLVPAGQFWQREDMDALEQYVAVCITAGKPQVILDLERCTFINSQALGLLVRLHMRCSEEGGKLVLFRPAPCVREVIEVAGLPAFCTIVTTPDELDALLESEG